MKRIPVVVCLLSLMIVLSACGEKALIDAAKKGDIATVKTLLNRGADVNLKCNIGKSAKMLATEKGQTEVIELLKQAGATQ